MKSWHKEQQRLAPHRLAAARAARRKAREERKAQLLKTGYGRMIARQQAGGVNKTKKHGRP